MELRQLEYFIVTCEKGSFNQAAECLYTTQPNVSKVIGNLEKELGQKLFVRSRRGLDITPYGRTILEYARNILQNVSMINLTKVCTGEVKFSVSTYPSNMISRLLADGYQEWGQAYVLEHLIGTVEEVCDNVAKGLSELGIVYIAKKQMQPFLHILSHKKLKYTELDECESCLYVGPHHPYYNAKAIKFEDLPKQKYVGGIRDFFSMEHHLNQVSLGAIRTNELQYALYTNSNQSILSMIEHTDMVSLGIDFVSEDYRIPTIRLLKIEDCEPFLSLGYVQQEDSELSAPAQTFLNHFKQLL